MKEKTKKIIALTLAVAMLPVMGLASMADNSFVRSELERYKEYEGLKANAWAPGSGPQYEFVWTYVPIPTLTETEKTAIKNKNYFKDVPASAWYAEAVNTMYESGIISGYSDGTFRPNQTVTLGELAKIFMVISGGKDVTHIKYSSSSPNPDNPRLGIYESHEFDINSDPWDTLALAYCEKYLDWPWQAGCYTDGVRNEKKPALRGQTLYFISNLTGSTSKTNLSEYADVDIVDLAGSLRKKQEDKGAKKWTVKDLPDKDVVMKDVKGLEDNSPDSYYGYLKNLSFTYNNTYYWGRYWYEDDGVVPYNLGIASGADSTGRMDPWGKVTRAQLCQMLYNAHLTEVRRIKNLDEDVANGYYVTKINPNSKLGYVIDNSEVAKQILIETQSKYDESLPQNSIPEINENDEDYLRLIQGTMEY